MGIRGVVSSAALADDDDKEDPPAELDAPEAATDSAVVPAGDDVADADKAAAAAVAAVAELEEDDSTDDEDEKKDAETLAAGPVPEIEMTDDKCEAVFDDPFAETGDGDELLPRRPRNDDTEGTRNVLLIDVAVDGTRGCNPPRHPT